MSSKKKTVVECTKCGRHILTKDEQKHSADCASSTKQTPSLETGGSFNALVQPIDDFIAFLPTDATGWTRLHSVLINPLTISMWGVLPRQPCLMKIGSSSSVVVPWPCKEISMLRIATRLSPNESFVELHPISEYIPVKRLELRLSDDEKVPVKLTPQLTDFLEAYLSHSFLNEDCPLSVSYFGHKIKFSPITPIDVKMERLQMKDSKAQPLVLSPTHDCSVFINLLGDRCSGDVNRSPSDAFEFIGGCTLVKSSLRRYVIDQVKLKQKPCSILLWGLAGNGKSLFINAIEKILGAISLKINSLDEIVEKQTLFDEHTFLLIDSNDYPREHKAYKILTDYMSNDKIGGVLLAARSADEVDIGVRVRFPRELEVSVPNEIDRLDILRVLSKSTMDMAQLENIARTTHGFTGGDLRNLLRLASFEEGEVFYDRLAKAQRHIRPTGIRQFILEVPNVKWESIGGNNQLKLEIQQAVLWPRQYPQAFARFGIEPPSGILLYGPPGCSKTLIARALANEAKMNFLAVKGPELFSKWVGESEKAIRDLFARARQVAPTIVFFDEIDAVGQARGATGSSVGDRVLAQLLTELDGLEKQAGVFLLAATNRPDQLDAALLRPGRLDQALYVGLPDEITRKEIIEMSLKTMAKNNALDEDLDRDSLITRTAGYSGAEIVALCRTAAMVAMRENVHVQVLEWRHFEAALLAIVPRTDQFLLNIYEKFKKGSDK